MAVVTYNATGRRKSSVARVRLVPGEGNIIINDRELNKYFGLKTLELMREAIREEKDLRGLIQIKGMGCSGCGGCV